VLEFSQAEVASIVRGLFDVFFSKSCKPKLIAKLLKKSVIVVAVKSRIGVSSRLVPQLHCHLNKLLQIERGIGSFSLARFHLILQSALVHSEDEGDTAHVKEVLDDLQKAQSVVGAAAV